MFGLAFWPGGLVSDWCAAAATRPPTVAVRLRAAQCDAACFAGLMRRVLLRTHLGSTYKRLSAPPLQGRAVQHHDRRARAQPLPGRARHGRRRHQLWHLPGVPGAGSLLVVPQCCMRDGSPETATPGLSAALVAYAHLPHQPHMCRRRPLPAAAQASKGVVFGTYMIKVDTIVAARTTRAEMSQIWKAVQTKFVPEDQVRGGEWC